jgi:RNA polymerase sigma factor (sigma-70 family)
LCKKNDHHEAFMAFIRPYRSDLSRYCRMMAGNPWDADDLFQETLIKAYQSSVSLGEHPAPKAYLFRIATHVWIDHCRKNKVPLDRYEDERFAVQTHALEFEVREALEELLCLLPPRQVSVLLLTDVFGFSARSAAAMMEMTEGALKAALHRARTTLKQAKEEEKQTRFRLRLKSVAELVDLFLKAFQQKNPVAVSRAYHALQYHGVEVMRVLNRGTVSFRFEDPDGNVFAVVARDEKYLHNDQE